MLYRWTMFFLVLLASTDCVKGQEKRNVPALEIISDIGRAYYYPGDTISFIVRNTTKRDRAFSIEAITADSKKLQIGYDAVYTAYFNDDSLFFKKYNEAKKLAKQVQVGFIMPDPAFKVFQVDALGSKTFSFVISGRKVKKGMQVRFRIVPDIVDDEAGFYPVTKLFYLCAGFN